MLPMSPQEVACEGANILMTSTTGCTNILPSPISPVWAVEAMIWTTLFTWSLHGSTSVTSFALCEEAKHEMVQVG